MTALPLQHVRDGESPRAQAAAPIQADFIAPQKGYATRLLTSVDELAAVQEDWSRLAAQSTDRNVFYEPWFLLPAARWLGASQNWRIVLVYRSAPRPQAPPLLCGLFPFVQTRGPGRLAQWSLWKHPYCYLTNPLIEAGQERDTLAAAYQLARRQTRCTELPLAAGDGPLHRGLVELVRDELATVYSVDRYLRATIDYRADPEESLRAAVGGHHLREFRRLRRKLERQGQLEYRTLSDERSLPLWLDWFLHLESQGWKARAGTALRLHPLAEQFFREVVRNGMLARRVRLEGLFLNGEPIALKCNLLSPPTCFAFKIAFDENLARFSPGVQLELDSIQHFAAHPDIHFGDSCAAPGHQMINRLWGGRRVVQHLLMSNKGAVSDLVIGALPLLRSMHRLSRRWRDSVLSPFCRS